MQTRGPPPIEAPPPLAPGAPALGGASPALPPPPLSPPPGAPAPAASAASDRWPRQILLADATLTLYQPQLESWKDDRLAFRAAVAAKPQDGGSETFGVIWGTARTQVDRVARLVSLRSITLPRSSFPTLPDNGANYLAEMQQQTSDTSIALDRVEASLAATTLAPAKGVAVKNTAPPNIVG